MMDSNEEYFYAEFMDLCRMMRNMAMKRLVRRILEEIEIVEEYVLNFKISTKGHRLLNQNRARGHMNLYDAYFAPNTLFEPYF